MKWAAPAGGSTYVGVAAYADNVYQAISSATSTAVLFPSEQWDTDAFHSTSSNTSRITIPTGKGGKYQLTAAVFMDAPITTAFVISVFKNGSAITGSGLQSGNIAQTYANADKIFGTTTVTAVATDYFELFVYVSYSSGARDVRYARFVADYLGA